MFARYTISVFEEAGKKDRPRVFYKGSNIGDTRRISTGDKEWDSHIFASSNREYATDYGKNISRLEAHPDARIAYEGTKEWRKIAGAPRKRESFLQYSSRAASALKNAGYHAAHFKLQGTVGTTIFSPEKFTVHKEE